MIIYGINPVLAAIKAGRVREFALRSAPTIGSRALGLSRFDQKHSSGTLSHEKMMASISLIGREVAPRVRDAARTR